MKLRLIGIFGVLILFIFIAYQITKDWDFSKLNNSKTVELSGSFESSDGLIQFFPEKLEVKHDGFYITVRYEIDEEIKELEFKYNQPRFTLEEDAIPNPEENDRMYIEEIRATDINLLSNEQGKYVVAYYSYDELKHFDPNRDYRLYLSHPGSFWKGENLDLTYEVSLDNKNELQIKDIGSYHVNFSVSEVDNSYQLHLFSKTYSELGSPFTVNTNILGINGDQTVRARGLTGIGSRSGDSLTWSNKNKYEVDKHFLNAERYQLEISSINLDVLQYPPHERVYIEF